MTARAPISPDLRRLPVWERLILVADFERLSPLPSRPLPVLDRWTLGRGDHGLLHVEGYLDGAAEQISLPLLTIVRDRPAVWLLGAHWVELGTKALDEDRDELEALLTVAERWCQTLDKEICDEL